MLRVITWNSIMHDTVPPMLKGTVVRHNGAPGRDLNHVPPKGKRRVAVRCFGVGLHFSITCIKTS